MKSGTHGTDISDVEVLNISPHGFWLLAGQSEYFLDYDHFPWFRDATVSQISNVQADFGRIFRWSDLDVDLDVDRISKPDDYPLVAK
jgi:hypothetical protein